MGNEHADALAKKSATTYSELADISIKTAGPEGNPFYNIQWLTKEDTRKPNTNPQTREVQPVRGPEKINMVLGCPVEAAQGRSGEPGNCRGDSPCDFRGTR